VITDIIIAGKSVLPRRAFSYSVVKPIVTALSRRPDISDITRYLLGEHASLHWGMTNEQQFENKLTTNNNG